LCIVYDFNLFFLNYKSQTNPGLTLFASRNSMDTLIKKG